MYMSRPCSMLKQLTYENVWVLVDIWSDYGHLSNTHALLCPKLRHHLPTFAFFCGLVRTQSDSDGSTNDHRHCHNLFFSHHFSSPTFQQQQKHYPRHSPTNEDLHVVFRFYSVLTAPMQFVCLPLLLSATCSDQDAHNCLCCRGFHFGNQQICSKTLMIGWNTSKRNDNIGRVHKDHFCHIQHAFTTTHTFLTNET